MCMMCDAWAAQAGSTFLAEAVPNEGQAPYDASFFARSSSDPAEAGGTGQALTGTQNIDGILSTFKWNATAIKFGFVQSSAWYPSSYTSTNEPGNSFGVFTGAMETAARAALAQASTFSGLTFAEQNTTSTAYTGVDLAFARSSSPSTAWAYYPNSSPVGGDVWFGYNYDGRPINGGSNYTNPIKGGYAWLTMVHEIGHALGLKHGHAGDTFVGGNTTVMTSDRDSMEFSVMTYRGYINAPVTGYVNEAFGYAQSYMMYDIAALQTMYGPNFNTNSGNTTYTFSPTTGEMFINGVGQGAPGGNRVFLTIWDGGGTDTYDFSNYTTNETIDLRPGQWSLVSSAQQAALGAGNFARGNVFNALQYQSDARSLIENAFGGSGNDSVLGNAANNDLRGNAGNDTLDGGAGADSLQGGDNNDTLYFDGLDVIVQGGNGTDIAVRNDGQSAFGFAMAANGIEELRWDLNGDSYVATLNIATGDIRVITNDGGPVNSDWASFTTDYTSAWAPKVQQGTYDTGGLWSINYDFASNQIFIDYTTVYKAGSILWYQSGRYDNGTTWSINWDTENAGNWRDYTTQYDALGRATVQTGTYDDGRKWSINWDVANTGNWRDYTTIYNAAGVALSQTGTYDNGTTWSIVF